ncbi:unnamed protein product, partial [Polarella glacialis]
TLGSRSHIQGEPDVQLLLFLLLLFLFLFLLLLSLFLLLLLLLFLFLLFAVVVVLLLFLLLPVPLPLVVAALVVALLLPLPLPLPLLPLLVLLVAVVVIMQRRDLESGYDPRAFEGLSDRRVRLGFVKRVYLTVTAQLAATAFLAAPIAVAGDAWLQAHAALMLYSSVGFIALLAVTFCWGDLLRKHPWNLVILAAFTSLESVSVGFMCAMYDLDSVVLCLAATAAVTA